MSKTEGIIKYALHFTEGPPPAVEEVLEINAWRKILVMTQLLGQDPDRYGGYGFGNISRRLRPYARPPHERRFLITGSQTGHITDLMPQHYTVVETCHPLENRLAAAGPIRPSSESLTHGAVYALDDHIRWVIHVHSPHIWQHAAALGLPTTAADAPYGSPAIAQEVERLFAETEVGKRRVFAMAGHEDGVVAFGSTAREAACALFAALVQAFEQNSLAGGRASA